MWFVLLIVSFVHLVRQLKRFHSQKSNEKSQKHDDRNEYLHMGTHRLRYWNVRCYWNGCDDVFLDQFYRKCGFVHLFYDQKISQQTMSSKTQRYAPIKIVIAWYNKYIINIFVISANFLASKRPGQGCTDYRSLPVTNDAETSTSTPIYVVVYPSANLQRE